MVQPKAQSSFDEKFIEDAKLEDLLEKRWQAKLDLDEPRADYESLNTKVKEAIAELALPPDVPHRVGRFPIRMATRAERSYQVDTPEKVGVRIGKPREMVLSGDGAQG